MTRILVAYCSNSGSTAEVAQVIARHLEIGGATTEARPVHDAGDADAWDAVVLGAPIIYGAWHGEAADFVRRAQHQLQHLPTAWFCTALQVTQLERDVQGVPVFYDPGIATRPRRPQRLSFAERHARPSQYVGDVLRRAPAVRPLSFAVFGGRTDRDNVSLPQRIFSGVAAKTPTDYRNWTAIREWTESLEGALAPATR